MITARKSHTTSMGMPVWHAYWRMHHLEGWQAVCDGKPSWTGKAVAYPTEDAALVAAKREHDKQLKAETGE